MAVVGTGVAGAYLLNRLPSGVEAEAFEAKTEKNWYTVCAWGTSEPFISDLVKEAGFNFSDYVLHRGRKMRVDLGDEELSIDLKGLVTYDKHRLTEDMLKGKKVHWGAQIKEAGALKDFDVVVDSTGLHRSLLPKVQDDLLIPSLEYQVKSKELPYDDFVIRPYPGLTGYWWYFPLGDGMAHVGAGDLRGRYRYELDEFVKKYHCDVVRRIGRPVRVTPPKFCGPFYTEGICLNCGKKTHHTRTLTDLGNITGSGKGGKGRSSERFEPSSLNGSEEDAMSAAVRTNSNYITRNTALHSNGMPTTATLDGSTEKRFDKPRSIPVGSLLSAQDATKGSPGISFTKNSGDDHCNCQDPSPDRPVIVGVGESIGTVYPMLGEGIIPSMQCVNLFVENLYDLDGYTRAVLDQYSIYAKVYEFIKAKVEDRFSLMKMWPTLLSIFLYMRGNTRRYGLETRVSDFYKIATRL